MDNEEQKLRNLLGDAYGHEPVNVPDMQQEWKRFEPLYFGKRKRRMIFWLFFAGLFMTGAGLVYYLIGDKREARIAVSTTVTHSETSNTRQEKVLPERADTHNKTGNAVKAQENPGPTIVSRTKPAEARNLNKVTEHTNSHQYANHAGSNGEGNAQASKELGKENKNVERRNPLELADAAKIGLGMGEESATNSGRESDDKHIMANSTMDSAKELSHDEKISKSDPTIVASDTSAGEKKDTPVIKVDSAKSQPDKLARGPKKFSFAIGLANQFSPFINKHFNPEFALHVRYGLGAVAFRTGLGIGFTHFNNYTYTSIRNYYDSTTIFQQKDSSVGRLTSSSYLIIPLQAEWRFRSFYVSAGANIMLPLRNRFETQVYVSESNVIRPGSYDSIVNSYTKTENLYRFTPSVQLTCQLGYTLGHFDLSLGIRQPVYNGLRRLDLPSAQFAKSKFNFLLGLAYRF